MQDFLYQLAFSIDEITDQLECGLLTETEALNITYEVTMASINDQYIKMNKGE